MNIYDVEAIEKQIEDIARENDGEIPEEKMEELVSAQMGAIESIEKICRYIRHLENFVSACKTERERIYLLQKKAENRIESVKKYMAPFVKKRGKFDAGTFQLSTRKSMRVDVDADFSDKEYVVSKIIESIDKSKLKSDLKSGKKIKGARLVEKENLQIK